LPLFFFSCPHVFLHAQFIVQAQALRSFSPSGSLLSFGGSFLSLGGGLLKLSGSLLSLSESLLSLGGDLLNLSGSLLNLSRSLLSYNSGLLNLSGSLLSFGGSLLKLSGSLLNCTRSLFIHKNRVNFKKNTTKTIVDMADLNGDGLPDLLLKKSDMPNILVQYNLGNGFSAIEPWTIPNWSLEIPVLPVPSIVPDRLVPNIPSSLRGNDVLSGKGRFSLDGGTISAHVSYGVIVVGSVS
jgi:hypothetical protein